MIELYIDNYYINVFVGQQPTILDFYKKNALFIDENDFKNEGTEVYLIISKDIINPKFSIIAFKSDPIGYGGFKPALYYEYETQTLFIGAGTIIKTYRLTDNKLIFQKNYGFGFWGWSKYKNYIVQQEELNFGIFNLKGEQLWETYVEPPYEFEFYDDSVTIKFDNIVESRNLLTGLIN